MSRKVPDGAIIFGFFCLVIGGAILVRSIPEQLPQRGPPTRATITRLTFTVSHIRATVILTLSGEDGSTGWDNVPTGQLTCRLGDVVPVEKVGVFLRLAGNACIKKPGPLWNEAARPQLRQWPPRQSTDSDGESAGARPPSF
jgi:hypothetical protein